MKYLVEAVSMFRIRYVIEAKDSRDACDEVERNCGNLKEFSQMHLDENIISVRKLETDIEYLDLFDIDNGYLSEWSDQQKFNFVNKISYD